MFSYKEYFGCLSSIIGKKKMSNGASPYRSLPKEHSLSFGMINQDLNKVTNNLLILSEYEIKKKNFKQREVEIGDKKLVTTQNLQNNNGNILSGPYMYIAVYVTRYDTR